MENRGLKTPHIVVLVTTANREEAEKILDILLEARLVACGNILSEVASVFRWAGKIEKAEECLVLLKSRKDLFERIAEVVKKLHSYEVPEIIAFEIADGSEAYLNWLENSLK